MKQSESSINIRLAKSSFEMHFTLNGNGALTLDFFFVFTLGCS